MRLLISTPDFPPASGGIQLLLERLGRELSNAEVVVVCPDQPGAAEFDARLPYAVRRVPAANRRWASIPRLWAELPAATRHFKPDVILSGHIICSPGAVLASQVVGAPVVQYCHAMELGTRARLARWALGHADRTIAVSRYTKRLAVAAGADPERTTVVFPGVDSPPNGGPPRLTADPRILTVARLENRYKGIDVMLRAMPLVLAKVPDARWTIIGDGDLRGEFEPASVRAGLGEHVKFLGRASDAERDAELAASRLFVMPSRVPAGGAGEGFGIAYLEAARFGVPSVGGSEGGGAEAIVDGQAGHLVDPLDHVALAEVVTDLLIDEERCARYGAAAHARAIEMSWSRMAAGVRSVLEAALAT